ncbi:MAG: FtsK/SpoIIIE domain-containing protein [Bacteroidetes bacterium]|nr:FtsK/SpoIIIE domain-containing protein [Bacteroidota bacterium]
MKELDEVIIKIDDFLSNPKNIIARTREIDSFDFNLLTQPFGQKLPEGFEVGVFTSSKGDDIPAFLPFADTNGIAFSIDKVSDFAFFNEILECSTFQILDAIEYNNFKLTLIDGKNHGIYFKYLFQFDDTVTGGKIYKNTDEINKVLNEILLHNINGHRFIVINNFPHGFTNESATILIKILNNAVNEKIKVLMTKEGEPSTSMADLDLSISNKLEVISFNRNNQWSSKSLSQVENIKGFFTLNFGSSFTESNMQAKVEIINIMNFTNSKHTDDNFDINEGIKIPFGIYHNKIFYFRLGHGVSNFHAIVGGRSGKGKTVFLDNLIARATALYNPDELRFVLLDMKGIEFNNYKKLPHVQAFCSSTNFENAIKIVEFLQCELKEREVLFNSVEANNIVDYKKKSGKILPRLLVIIDEFQNLFTGNYKTDGFVEDILIKQILRIGRAYGVHLLCCTQSLGDGVRSSFLNNIPLRIAFQMTQDQSRSFLSPNNPAADSLKIGEAIYNEQDGQLNDNYLVKVDHIKSEDIQKLLLDFVENGKSYQPFNKIIVEK